ncbi:MAG: HAMP domain-containing histidine kinase [Clostridiales bacterium]|nr:HAMP domain-containing histidine kinase [Clostridiales bacterium]
MKIRNIFIFYTILVVIFGIVLWKKIDTGRGAELDMLELNTRRDQVIAELESGAERPRLEKVYRCGIAMVSDENYEAQNALWIRDGWSVFDYITEDGIVGKIAFDARAEEYQAIAREQQINVLIGCAATYVMGLLLLAVIWYFYVRPFKELRTFATQVSHGNLDMPLKMTRHNYFGVFTESFDRMREALKASAEKEAQADRSKKELVAELSHDIKTPVATIQATCEVMEMKYKEPDIAEKISVIKSKATSVEKLIDNMFRATLEDLEELKVTPLEESSLIIDEMLGELRFYGQVEKHGEVPECLIHADKLRLEQVIDNIAGNSFKYAGTPLEVDFVSDKDSLHVILSDRGPGVPEEELALITTKFYRGSEAAGKDGSGLGLYLASIFMERMGGGLEVRNREGGGFQAEIVLKKV